jgi:CheY-specific phosphatase CheX
MSAPALAPSPVPPAHKVRGAGDAVPLLEIDGANDADGRDVTFDGDVVVSGSLRAGRKLTATGSVRVTEAVEAVELHAAANLSVTGGIVGGETGTCSAGGELSCRFVSGGALRTAGPITVDGEIAHARVATSAALVVNRGPIYGGIVSANGGIHCQILGKPAGTRTVVEAGMDRRLLDDVIAGVPQIEARRKHAREVRSKLEPLLKHERALSRQQRERATELLWEAGELSKAADQEVVALADRDRAAQTRSTPTIVVAQRVYPGVTVRFPGVEAEVTAEIAGPVTIGVRQSGSATTIVATDGATGEERVLDSRPATEPAEPLLNRVVRARANETGVRARCINAFVAATQDLFKTMIRVPLSLTKPRLKERGERVYKLYRISAGVRIAGTIEGFAWISFSEKVAVAIASALGGQPFKTLDDPDCRDALGEIANMIVGSAKRTIAVGPLNVSVPVLQPTEDVEYPPNAPVILLPFDTAFGRFIIEFAMSERAAA